MLTHSQDVVRMIKWKLKKQIGKVTTESKKPEILQPRRLAR